MKVVRLESGLISQRLTEKEQNIIWKELSEDVSPVGKNIELRTPNDNLKYFIISETRLKNDNFESVIKTNGKIIKVKHNIYNQDEKINAAVRRSN